ARIANAGCDFLHKASTAIRKNHAIVCIGDLQVQNMSKSATGTTEQPGRNVSTKAGLNKAILDQGWFEFRHQLDYKLVWRGGRLVLVLPQNRSRTCLCCGHVSADNRQTQARFVWVAYGFEDNADQVGAINTTTSCLAGGKSGQRRAGHVRMTRGSNRVGGRKQEPVVRFSGRESLATQEWLNTTAVGISDL
ncbi:MAG: transposase, partial [Thermostichus sp. DG02_3_bins_51]